MEISQIVAVGIIGTVLAVTLRKEGPQFSLFIGICTGIIIFIFISEKLMTVMEILKSMADKSGIDFTYIKIVLKVIGIAYIAQFGSELCRDAGEGAVASKIELAGKVLIMASAAPVLMALMEVVTGISL